MIIDTHCHLHFDAFDPDREEVIKRAREFGVRYLINVGTDPTTNEAAANLADKHDFIFHTSGLHPHHSHQVDEAAIEGIERFIVERKPVAVGEIGLDYFKSEAAPEAQKRSFKRMLGLAAKYDLPVIVHSRNAFDDTLEILKNETGGKARGVMHCFSYDQASLERVLELGMSVSFTCNLTFKNTTALLDVAKAVPLDRVMLETDSPYLAPQIYRGKRNEPSCLVHLAQFLAAQRGISQAQLEKATSANAIRLFGLSVDSDA